jgi:hypothetical protein
MKSLVTVHHLVLYEAVVVLALAPFLSRFLLRFPILTTLAFHILPVLVSLILNSGKVRNREGSVGRRQVLHTDC